jgi:hypothetical protein
MASKPLVTAALFCIILSCSSIESSEVPLSAGNIQRTIIPNLCYVLCDFSASQGNKSREAIRSNALKIYETAKTKCKIRYYDINAPEFQLPFFEFLPLFKEAKTPMQQRKILLLAKTQSHTLDSLIKSNYASGASGQTCIIKALSKIAQSLTHHARQNKTQNISIIVLSDMLEDCDFTFGKINIDNRNMELAFKTLAQMPKPAFTFKEYPDLKITLTASSDKRADIDKLHAFWMAVLKKFDYELTDPITTDLPNWVN